MDKSTAEAVVDNFLNSRGILAGLGNIVNPWSDSGYFNAVSDLFSYVKDSDRLTLPETAKIINAVKIR